MELIRYKVKDDTVMGVLIDYDWGLGVCRSRIDKYCQFPRQRRRPNGH